MTIKIIQSQVHALGWGSDDAVGNSLGVRRKLAGDIGSLPGWHREFARRRPRLAERLLGVAERLAGRLDDAEGARQEFARRFTEGIGKLARNMPRDRQRKTVRLTAVESGGCRIAGVRS
ncbi:hypothetical protein B296_00056900 [Ensete ventricosum]|uniref:Uncharacterized protein n=1 Tax=Ensete ventricosum TaxID=4639 RepID=A0A426X8E7_ENSVE|nr:hypothetical protein B296_00056900 [Ensete ventricosum]